MPTSIAEMSVPPIWAAWERADKNSTEAPTRLLILSSASPAEANCLTATSSGASSAAPAAKSLVPSDVTLAPQAFSRIEAAFRPRTSRLSSANSSTNARPARIPWLLAIYSHLSTNTCLRMLKSLVLACGFSWQRTNGLNSAGFIARAPLPRWAL